MSTGDVAAFMRRMEIDEQLRREMAAMASARGFVFTHEELAGIDFEAACGRLVEKPREVEDAQEVVESDPGFGIIEIPA